jgi:CelD/BcsL family acetyltransferase involved in cellulose biosynthesis
VIEFEALDQVSPELWDEWLQACPGARVYHSWSWMRFLEATQPGRAVLARIRDDGATVGVFCGRLLSKVGLRILGSPLPGWTTHYMGPILFGGRRLDSTILRALDGWVFRELGCAHFEFLSRDLVMADLERLGFAAQALPSYSIDLRAEPERIFREFNKGCKWSIHKAEREGLVVEEARDPQFVAEYYEQLKDVFAKQGLAPTYPRSRVEALFRCLGSEHLLGMRVRTREGDCAATAIVTRDRNCGYLWGAASWRHHQKLCPNELIQWRLMLRLRELGVPEYDFGGGGSYKAKYGGKPISTPWFYKSRNPVLASLRSVYRGAIRARQRLRGWRGARG